MRTSHNALIVFFRVLMFICFFGCFIAGAIYSTEKNFLADIQNEYTYYQEMISNAQAQEANGKDYIIKATVTGIYTRYDSSGKYRILYVFQTPNGLDNEGYTFDTYTKERAEQIRDQGYIEIAVDSLPITTLTDSIDVEYQTTTLEDDGQYMYNKKETDRCLTVTLCFGVGIVIFVVLQAILTKKFTKKDDGEVATQTTSTSIEGSKEQRYSYTTNINYPLRKKRKCAYCNSRIKDGEDTCSRCGAAVRDD